MRRIRTALTVIALNNLLLTLGFRLWQSMFNNFAVEELGVRADQIGLVQAIREVPGLLGFLMGVLVLFVLEMRIAGLSIVLMGAGIFLTAAARDLTGLIGATLVMSVGFHFFYSRHLPGANHQPHRGSHRTGGGRGGGGGARSVVHLPGRSCHGAAVAGGDVAHTHTTTRADRGPLPNPVSLEPVQRMQEIAFPRQGDLFPTTTLRHA